MSIFWFDRVQFIEDKKKMIIFEFYECSKKSIQSVNMASFSDDLLSSILDDFTYEKHRCIKKLISNKNIVYYILLYNEIDPEPKKVIAYENGAIQGITTFNNFLELQKWFLELNDINRNSKSKVLGDIRTDNNYSDKIIKSYWGEKINENDDQGLSYTIKLLTVKTSTGKEKVYETKGFDYDLFVYFEEDNVIMNVEFALNNQDHKRANTTCTPMKYCWGRNANSSASDNQRKYNNLWLTTKLLNGEFFVLNFSKNDKLCGLQHIKELSTSTGILEERKYRIKPKSFTKAIHELGGRSILDLSILERYSESIEDYNHAFFDGFENRKYDYK